MKTNDGERRSALYIDMAYSVQEVLKRGHDQFFEARHSGSYFSYIWGLHPMVDRVSKDADREVRLIEFSPRQTVIEGRAELFPLPGFLLPINVILSQLVLLIRVARLVFRERVSVIIATDPMYSGLFGLFVKAICRRPLAVYILANFDDLYEARGTLAMPKLFRFRAVERWVSRLVLSRADLVAPGTHTLVDYAVRNGANPERVSVFLVSKNLNAVHRRPPAERPSADGAFRRLGIPQAEVYLLSVARLMPEKHVEDALMAMKVVMDRLPDAVGIFAGDGVLRSDMEKLAVELGISDRTFFPGVIDQQLLSEIIPRCITLSPLTGMALFECAMGGSPAIAYNRDSQVSALVQNGRTGFIVDFLDWQAMGERALEIAGDREMWLRMASETRAVALSYADLDILFANEQSAFERMFARSNS